MRRRNCQKEAIWDVGFKCTDFLKEGAGRDKVWELLM
jgi:hypothetical protein